MEVDSLPQVMMHRVNGAFLAQSVGKRIIIMGTVLKMNPNGRCWEMKTVDSRVVSVTMQEPLDEPLTGLVEVHGTSQGKSSVVGETYIAFPQEMAAKFNEDDHNEALNIINTISNFWRD